MRAIRGSTTVRRTTILGSLGRSPCGPSEAQGVAGRCTRADARQDREVQSDRAGEGPAPIARCQEPVRAPKESRQGQGQALDQKHGAAFHPVGAGQSEDRETAMVCTRRPRGVLLGRQSANAARKGLNSTRSARDCAYNPRESNPFEPLTHLAGLVVTHIASIGIRSVCP